MKNGKLIGMLSALCVIALAGCGDKNLEDYQREQASRDLSKLDNARGDFSGYLKRSLNGETMGALLIRFTPELRPTAGKAGTTESTLSPNQAALIADIEFQGKGEYRAHVKDGLFNPDTGQYDVDLKISRASGTAETLSLRGKIVGNRFEGTLQAPGFSQMAGEFSLVRDGAKMAQMLKELPSQGVEVGSVSPDLQSSTVQTYMGKTKFSSRTLPVSLVVTEDRKSPSEEVLQLFYPNRKVFFTLNYGGNLTFASTEMTWDLRRGSLSGGFVAREQNITLDCQVSEETKVLRCDHSAANGVVARSEFKSGAIESLPDPFGVVVASKYCSVPGVVVEMPPSLTKPKPETLAAPSAKGKKPTPPKPAPKPPVETPSKPARPSLITIVYSAHSSMDDLLDLFLPKSGKSVQVTVDLHANTNVVVPFTNTTYDPVGKIIEGAAEFNQGSDHFSFTLKCKNFSIEEPTAFTCLYFSSRLAKPIPLSFSDPAKWKCE